MGGRCRCGRLTAIGPAPQRRLALAVITLLLGLCDAAVRRPSSGAFLLDFEDLTAGTCQFSQGIPISDEYASSSVGFVGPGFGGMNGGVPMDGCALSAGGFPPLGNDSFAGSGFLGFSTVHTFTGGRTGKAIAPETVRFDSRMTNIVASFAGIDNHNVHIELWSGPGNSYNDGGVLLQSFELPMLGRLQAYNLVDENDIFVDCVRRMEISSPAKMFVLDNLEYALSAAGDEICVNDPAIAEAAAEAALQAALDGVGQSSDAVARMHSGARWRAAVTATAAVLAAAAAQRRRC